MKNLLIISSTKNTNLDLSYEIKKYLDNYGDEEISILSLEEYDLPLYTPTLEEKLAGSTQIFLVPRVQPR